MFLNSLLLILLLIFSFAIFFINNIYVLLLIITITLFASILLKVKLPINYAFVLIILFNFILNIIFSNLYDAFLVSIRLIEMFLMVNLIITKIGIYNLGLVIEKITHSHELYLIIVIALSFIPLMSKELKETVSDVKETVEQLKSLTNKTKKLGIDW